MEAYGLTTVADVAAAASRIAEYARRTPLLDVDPTFGARRVVLKLECLQLSGSFKIRGALNKLIADRAHYTRVAAASGGNHGVAVATASAELGLEAHVFVPSSAPAEKVRRIAAAGGNARVIDGPFAEAALECARFAESEDALLVHPFDDPAVIAGQGTLALELLEQLPEVTKVVVAVGGGGLAAGVAAALAGQAELVAVEPEQCPTLAAALDAGTPVNVHVGGVAVDSLGAPRLGSLAFDLLQPVVSRVALVPDARIVAAQQFLWEEYRLALEPAAASGWAALADGMIECNGDDVVAVVACGGNVDLASIPRAAG